MRIRPARRDDKPFILGLAPRLVEFGTVPHRDPSQMVARDRTALAKTLDQPSPDTELFVAEDDNAGAVGFLHLTTASDYYTDAATAHVADVVVAPEAERRGVGRALLAYAEGWARQRGFAMLTLNVFAANRRARDVYAGAGFQEEWIRCIKRL
jgi:GNAT superfamily N-acetyltransferase